MLVLIRATALATGLERNRCRLHAWPWPSGIPRLPGRDAGGAQGQGVTVEGSDAQAVKAAGEKFLSTRTSGGVVRQAEVLRGLYQLECRVQNLTA